MRVRACGHKHHQWPRMFGAVDGRSNFCLCWRNWETQVEPISAGSMSYLYACVRWIISVRGISLRLKGFCSAVVCWLLLQLALLSIARFGGTVYEKIFEFVIRFTRSATGKLGRANALSTLKLLGVFTEYEDYHSKETFLDEGL